MVLNGFHRFQEIADYNLEIEPFLDEAVDELERLTGCSEVRIRLIGEKGKPPGTGICDDETSLRKMVDRGSSNPLIADKTFMSRSRQQAASITGEPFVQRSLFEKGEQCEALFDALPSRQQRNKSIALVPIAVDQSLLGWIYAANPARRNLSRETVKALRSAANLLGRALQRIIQERDRIESFDCFQSTFHLAPVGITHVAPDGSFLRVNKKFCDIVGYTQKEILGRSFNDITHPDDLAIDIDRMNRLKSGEQDTYTVEKRYIRKDGSSVWVDLTVSVVLDQHNEARYFISAVQDISPRKKAEKDRARLATAVDQVEEVVIITNHRGTVEYVNPAFEQITGYCHEETLGRSWRAVRGWTELNQPSRQGMFECLREGRTWKGQFVRIHDAGAPYELETTISPIKDAAGQITHFVAIARDITREKTWKKRLEHAQKMEAVGTLAGGIAHDFNNILAAIIGHAEIALQFLSTDDRSQQHLSKVLEASLRAKDLVTQMLTFSRQEKQEKKPLRLIPLIDDVLAKIRPSLPPSIEVSHRTHCTSDSVLADLSQIQLLVMNLCNNAAYALRGCSGTLEISLEDAVVETRAAVDYPGLEPGPYLRLSVRDTGSGINEELKERIFDPFFTTKGPQEGRGLGLSVAHGIVNSHKGMISVESEPGVGTAFHIFLPQLEPERSGPKESKPRGNNGREAQQSILFVDDEQSLCQVFQTMVETLGYRVETRSNSVEALADFQSRPHVFDLVVTDQNMPYMKGEDLAREIRRLRPELPILLCTGYRESIDEDRFRAAGIDRILLKPVVMSEIEKNIKEMLEGAERKALSS